MSSIERHSIVPFDLLDGGNEEVNDSQDWVQLINRGGLTRVNHTTFEMFVAIEYELCKNMHSSRINTEFGAHHHCDN